MKFLKLLILPCFAVTTTYASTLPSPSGNQTWQLYYSGSLDGGSLTAFASNISGQTFFGTSAGNVYVIDKVNLFTKDNNYTLGGGITALLGGIRKNIYAGTANGVLFSQQSPHGDWVKLDLPTPDGGSITSIVDSNENADDIIIGTNAGHVYGINTQNPVAWKQLGASTVGNGNSIVNLIKPGVGLSASVKGDESVYIYDKNNNIWNPAGDQSPAVGAIGSIAIAIPNQSIAAGGADNIALLYKSILMKSWVWKYLQPAPLDSSATFTSLSTWGSYIYAATNTGDVFKCDVANTYQCQALGDKLAAPVENMSVEGADIFVSLKTVAPAITIYSYK